MASHELKLAPSPRGLTDLTSHVRPIVHRSGIASGLCNLFILHTSASLLIQENSDPSVRRDLEAWLSRLVKEGDPLYTHRDEGPDDMPAHIKAALTCSSLSIPIINSALALGRWQGVYLWEHRTHASARSLVITLLGAAGGTD
ncbi:MAG: YjbQ family protein [Phycisphaerales bacterium]|nr:YjbQ family protein [Phycisphaerales bacterium]